MQRLWHWALSDLPSYYPCLVRPQRIRCHLSHHLHRHETLSTEDIMATTTVESFHLKDYTQREPLQGTSILLKQTVCLSSSPGVITEGDLFMPEEMKCTREYSQYLIVVIALVVHVEIKKKVDFSKILVYFLVQGPALAGACVLMVSCFKYQLYNHRWGQN